MKGYCKCGKEIDEVEFTQFGSCVECFKIQEFKNIGNLNILANELEKIGLTLTPKLIREFINDYIKIKGVDLI